MARRDPSARPGCIKLLPSSSLIVRRTREIGIVVHILTNDEASSFNTSVTNGLYVADLSGSTLRSMTCLL
jgi:hypothetical protein